MKKVLDLKATWILPFALAIPFSSCTKMEEVSVPDDSTPVVRPVEPSQVRTDVVRVKLNAQYAEKLENMAEKSGVVLSTKSDMLFGVPGVKYMRRTFPYSGKFEARTRAAGLHLWYDVYLDQEQTAVTKAQTGFISSEGVETVELLPKLRRDGKVVPVSAAKLASVKSSENAPFNDPLFSEQWHYLNDGTKPNAVAGADINVVPVWKEFTTGKAKAEGREVIVAVIDGGVDVNHEDLAANMWVNEAELNGTPGVDDDGNGYVDDVYGYNFIDYNDNIEPDDHGTHVAGVVAAVNNNGIGVCGIAGGDYAQGIEGAKIMTCELFDYDNNFGNFAAAIKYAADNGAVIAQNSWSHSYALPDSERAAMEYFIKNAGCDEEGNQTGPMKGGIIFFAAANDNTEMEYWPSAYESVIAVSSMANSFKKSSFSNYGDWVDVAAPGGEDPAGDGEYVFSTIRTVNGGYGEMSGTSMACPHVSGLAALLAAWHSDEDGFTPDKMRSIIENTGTNIYGYNDEMYRGKLGKLINAYNAFTRSESEQAPLAVDDLEVSTNSNFVTAGWTVTADNDEPDGRAAGFMFCYSTQQFDSSVDVYDLPESISTIMFENSDYKAGEKVSETAGHFEFDTEYYFGIYAYDFSGNRSAMSNVVCVPTGSNTAPVIDPESIDIVLEPGEKKTLTFKFSDPDGHSVSWSVMRASSAVTSTEISENEVEIVFDASKASPRAYEGRLTVTDEFGLSTQAPLLYTIKGLHAPQVSVPFDDITLKPGGESVIFHLDEHFSDEDGEYLTYSVAVSEENIVNLELDEELLTITSVGEGSVIVSVTAHDTSGESVTAEFNVSVGDGSAPVTGDGEFASVYPNVVTDSFELTLAVDAVAELRLINPLGHVVMKESVQLSQGVPYEIDMEGRAAGTYVLEVKAAGQTAKMRIVKL